MFMCACMLSTAQYWGQQDSVVHVGGHPYIHYAVLLSLIIFISSI